MPVTNVKLDACGLLLPISLPLSSAGGPCPRFFACSLSLSLTVSLRSFPWSILLAPATIGIFNELNKRRKKGEKVFKIQLISAQLRGERADCGRGPNTA